MAGASRRRVARPATRRPDRRAWRRAAADHPRGPRRALSALPGRSPMTHDGRRHAILAIDTATTRVVIATGSPEGVVDGVSTWTAGYRHGETLLPTIGRFLGEQNIRRSRLVGIVGGSGP